MKKLVVTKELFLIIFLFFLFAICVRVHSQTILTNEQVGGIWTKANSPYIVLRNITVPEDTMLIVEPGVQVQFASGFGIKVYGNLVAVGDDNDKIIFTSADTTSVKNDSTLGWDGITILGESPDTCFIENCVVEYAYTNQDSYGIVRSAVNIQNRYVFINKCAINKNFGSYGGGIYCTDEANMLISNSVISGNSATESGVYGGIIIRYSNAVIVNNLISNNGIGIRILYTNENADTIQVLNNTIVQNTQLNNYWYENIEIIRSKVNFQNCIIWNNSDPENDLNKLVEVSSSEFARFENCIIPGGNSAIKLGLANYIVVDNIFNTNPYFDDAENDNYQLSDSSYGINGGENYTFDILTYIPHDLTGNPRIYDDAEDIIDIGAYEFQGEAVNRAPVNNNPGTRHVLTSTSKEMMFSFSDVDHDDTHTLSVTSDCPDITISELSAQTNNAVYTIDPDPAWIGEADIILSVTDNHGAQDIDTFKFVVSDSVNYNIDENTVWDADTVYITNSFEILNGATLEIREGTCVQFMDDYYIQVYGVIEAHGTAVNKIRFTTSDSSGYSQQMHTGWSGIGLYNHHESSLFDNCIFEYVKEKSVLKISGGTTVDIVSCIFKNNILHGAGYYNVIEVDDSYVFIGNSLFFENTYDIIIQSSNSDVDLYNNTFCNNEVKYRIVYLYLGNAVIKNSVFWNNNFISVDKRAVSDYYVSDLKITNCLIEGGESAVSEPAANVTIESIFNLYPRFVDSVNKNFHLQSNSPGINKGIEDAQMLKLNDIDLDGNDRIFNGVTEIPDIGAYEYQGDPSNRAPVIEKVEDRTAMLGLPLDASVHFYDADETDTHTITVLSNDVNVDIQNLSGDTTGSVYTLVPAPGFNDTALISVIVEDNGGLKDSVSYSLMADPCACGSIYDDMVWDEDTVYITCDVTIENNATLTINPGTKVIFHGPYCLNVKGTLKAEGAENDTIRFMLSDTIIFNDTIHYGAWMGIIFDPDEEQDTSRMSFCEIKNSKDGGLKFEYRSKAIITKSHIHHNLIDDYYGDGAGIYTNYPSYLKIMDNYIHHNISNSYGGGLYIHNPYNCQILNNTISDNIARSGGAGIYSQSYSSMGSVIEGNTIESNQTTSGSGAGIYSHAQDTIRNNIIRNNYSYGSGAGIHGYQNGVIINNIIDGNFCNDENSTYGGGLYLYAGYYNIANNLIINNYARTGGAGAYLSSVRGVVANNTVSKNSTDNKGNAIYLSGNYSPTIVNNIIWGNSSPGSGNQIHINDESLQPEISYCLIEGGIDSISYPTSMYRLNEYENNIDQNPDFVDFTNNNFELTDSSICINTGLEDTTGIIPEYDIAGNDRIFNGAVEKIDLGAYEFIGEPVNRHPWIRETEDVILLSSQLKQMTVEYIDNDAGDSHTLTIESSDPNLSVENISGDTTHSTYDIVGATGWQGSATVKLRVEDSGGLADSVSYTVTVNDTICGNIGDRTVWDRDTMVVSCHVVVPEHQTLTIHPGTVVLFTSGNSISVYGTLKAEGTPADSIEFILNDESGTYSHWGGIDFYRNTVNDTSKLSYCNFNYSYNFRIESGKVIVANCHFDHCMGSNGGAMNIVNSSPVIENCLFTNNYAWSRGGAISCIDEDYFDYIDTKPRIKGNEFIYNSADYGGAIYCRESDAGITENSIHNNNADYYGGAVYLRECDDPVLNNNIMYENSTSNGGAVYVYNTHGYYINNTIIKNKSTVGGAFHITNYSHPQVYNSIIYYNEAKNSGNQVYLEDDRSDPSFYNCFIQYGLDSITGDGAGHEYTGHFVNNLGADPLFVDTTNNNYQLSDSSFCINAGTINIENAQLPAEDILDNPRVFAGELSNVDVGAYEFQGNPINRKPYIVKTEDQYTQISQRKKLSVHFSDVDKTDIHTITISTNNGNVTIENKSGDVSGSTYELVPEDEWDGIAEIFVRVEDDKSNYAIDTFNLIVSEYFCGSISEDMTWDADTIKVACDVEVEENATLTILPGTVVTFDDYVQLKVTGRLLAVGTEENRIVFTSSDISAYPDESYAGWRGIRFYGPGSNDTSRLDYCTIQYAKGVDQNYSGDEYGGGLFFDDWHMAVVSHCIIHHNTAVEIGGGIYCSGGRLYSSVSNVRFENNIISNNYATRGGGIYTSRGNINPNTNYLINNIICNNSALNGGGIYCDDLYCFNNIIVNNEASVGGGLYINNNTVDIVNSVIWGNVANISSSSNQIGISWSDNLNLYNNVIEGGLSGIDSEGAVDINENMITEDPGFISPSQGAGKDNNGLIANWSVLANSSCINKGTLDYHTRFEYLAKDIIGEERILMDIIDIGVYEFRNDAPVKISDVPNQQVQSELENNISIPVNGIFNDSNLGDILTYSVSASDSPGWLSIDMVSDNISITGTPGTDDIGTTTLGILSVTDLFGETCTDTFEIEVVGALVIGNIQDDQFSIYPVPAKDVINIKSENSDCIYQVELLDVNGESIETLTMHNEGVDYKMDVSSVSPGLYYLKIQSNNECKIYKIIKL